MPTQLSNLPVNKPASTLRRKWNTLLPATNIRRQMIPIGDLANEIAFQNDINTLLALIEAPNVPWCAEAPLTMRNSRPSQKTVPGFPAAPDFPVSDFAVTDLTNPDATMPDLEAVSRLSA